MQTGFLNFIRGELISPFIRLFFRLYIFLGCYCLQEEPDLPDTLRI
jgi:hypothetical protein